jgi:hypothetical protein
MISQKAKKKHYFICTTTPMTPKIHIVLGEDLEAQKKI